MFFNFWAFLHVLNFLINSTSMFLCSWFICKFGQNCYEIALFCTKFAEITPRIRPFDQSSGYWGIISTLKFNPRTDLSMKKCVIFLDLSWRFYHQYIGWFCYKMVVKHVKIQIESVQLGYTYIAYMNKCPQDKCCLDKCCGNSCNLLYMFPGPFV